MLDLILITLNSCLTSLRGQAALQAEIIALRHQLTAANRKSKADAAAGGFTSILASTDGGGLARRMVKFTSAGIFACKSGTAQIFAWAGCEFEAWTVGVFAESDGGRD